MPSASSCRLFALALLSALVFASSAFAAGGEKSGGLDFTGIKRYDLGIYTLIVFGLLMFILSKLAWPKIKAGLEAREANILGALDQAKKERVEAAELLAKAKKELDETAKQVKEILDEARRDAEALKVAKVEEGVKEAQAERERAKRDTEANKTTMAKEMTAQVIELATMIASKALRQQVSIQTQNALLDESLAELKATTANRA